MEESNACVSETGRIYADYQKESYFLWRLATARGSSFSDIYFHGDIHFQAAFQSYSSVKNVFLNHNYMK